MIETIAAALVALGVMTTAQSGPTGPLTLDQAVALGTRNAFAVGLQASRVEQIRQLANAEGANLGPRLDANLGLTRLQNQQGQVFGQNFIVTQPLYQRTAGVNFTLPIDIAGNLTRAYRAAQSNEASARQSFRAVTNDVRLNVRTAYFNVLRGAALVQVQQQNVADATERLRQGRLLFENAQIARIDVERFDAQVQQAQSDLLVARNNLILAQQQLNFTLARPIETPVDLVDVVDLPPIPPSPEPLVTAAQRERPEVLALRDTIRAAGYTVRATEAGLNPTLSVGYNYSYNFDAINQAPNDREAFVATLNLPIFDSGATRARVRAARQNVVQAEINLRQQTLQVSSDVRGAFTNITIARARLENAERQVALAEEVFRLARIRQEAATGTYVETIDAQTQLVLARNNLTSARYDFLVGYATLQRALGRDDLSLTAPAPVVPPPGANR